MSSLIGPLASHMSRTATNGGWSEPFPKCTAPHRRDLCLFGHNVGRVLVAPADLQSGKPGERIAVNAHWPLGALVVVTAQFSWPATTGPV